MNSAPPNNLPPLGSTPEFKEWVESEVCDLLIFLEFLEIKASSVQP